MVRLEDAASAADEFLAAALLGEGWEDALQRFAEAADAGGATLMRMRNTRPLAVMSSTAWVEADSALLRGLAPPSPRRFYPDRVFGEGFVGDTAIWSAQELYRDAYFQEFLRPRGVFFHAKARLAADGGERISLSLKHRVELGPYEPSDLAVLDQVLPKLRGAVRVARHILDAEASGMVRMLHNRGNAAFELDAWGRVLRLHGEANDGLGVVARSRRLRAAHRRDQTALEQAVSAAVTAPHQPATIGITNRHGELRFLHLTPVTGRARDVFLATAAIAVVVDPVRERQAAPAALIGRVLGLTEREAQVAALLAEGVNLTAISDRLHIGLGTVRNHLKSAFAKTGVRRQGELIVLLRSVLHRERHGAPIR